MAAVRDEVSTQVLVAGGGPVGLGLAIDLGMRGIESVVVDMRNGTVTAPKMSQVSARSMEFCRRWGVAEEVENVGWPRHLPYDFVYVTSLTGYELARSKWPSYGAGVEHAYTPHGTAHCPQIYFDPVLQKRARRDPKISLNYNTRLLAFEQSEAGVRATVEGPRGRYVVNAQYMVGCDGAESLVRSILDIPFRGEGHLSHSLSIFFRSRDVMSIHTKAWGRFYRMVDETGHWGDLVSIDGKELWRLTLLDCREPMGPAQAGEALARAAGRDFSCEVISALPWERRDLLADRYAQGRVFICGDAAHVLSPTGGLGMNTGLCDAVDLAWKFEAVFKGWAGDRLLHSYEAERRPIAQRNITESTDYFRRTRVLFPKGQPLREVSEAGAAARAKFAAEFARLENDGLLYVSEHLKLGFTYESSPLCVSDGTSPPHVPGIDYVVNARVGARAPHVWLSGGRSMLDLFGNGFVLLCFDADPSAAANLAEAARAKGVPITVHAIASRQAAEIYENRFVLVRPDGHICWRGEETPRSPSRLIDIVRGQGNRFNPPQSR
jgi:2-polyprenyl-6-methoxyphenol hydroxylase-like FAD-dependent oxidoreductase